MKILYFFLVLILIVNPVSAWFNDSYESKYVYNITNGCTYCVINISTTFNKSDRWVNESDDMLLSFWKEDNNHVWVNLTSNGSYQIAKYINQTNQYDSLSNGNTTFQAFNENSSGNFLLSNLAGVQQNNVITYKYTSSLTGANYIGVSSAAPFGNDMIYIEITGSASVKKPTTYNDGVYTQHTISTYAPTTNIYDFIFSSLDVKFYYDNALVDTITSNIPDSNMGLFMQSPAGSYTIYAFIRQNNITTPTATGFKTYCRNNLYPCISDTIFLKSNKILYKITDGQIIFKTIFYEDLNGSIITYLNDDFIIVNTNNFLYKINSINGTIAFKISIRNVIDKTVSINAIYLITDEHMLYTVNKDNGEIMFKTFIGKNFEFVERIT